MAVGGRIVVSGFCQGDGAGLRLGDGFRHDRVRLICSQFGGAPAQVADRWSVERRQATFLRLVAEGKVDVKPLVSHVVPVAEAAGAYHLLDERPADALQVVLEF